MSLENKILKQSMQYTFMWILFHSIIGLAPFLLYYFHCCMFPKLGFSTEKVVDEGLILFFASTMTGVVALDVYFAGYKIENKLWGLIIVLIPSITLLISVFLFGQLYFEGKSDTNINYKLIYHVQFFIVALTYLYAVTLKIMLFTEEITKELEQAHTVQLEQS